MRLVVTRDCRVRPVAAAAAAADFATSGNFRDYKLIIINLT